MSTNTFLEFNRDLFLCNTIHDPQNTEDVVPTITNGNIYKKKRTVDPFDNIYILPKNYFNDQEAYNNGIIHNTEPITTTYTEDHPDYVKGMYWMGSKITYDKYIQNLDTYLNGDMDVWVGSGKVALTITNPKPPVETSTHTKDKAGSSTTITTAPDKHELDKMLLNLSSFGLTGIEGIINHEIFLYNKGLNVSNEFKNIQGDIQTLKQNMDGITTNRTTITAGVLGHSTYNSTNSKTYTFSVEGGSLVKLDRSFVGSCKDYHLKTICPRDDAQKQENCEICKNFQYRDWYDQNNPTQINLNARYDDATSEYHHMWLQTWNLGIGIIALAYGIYYQLS